MSPSRSRSRPASRSKSRSRPKDRSRSRSALRSSRSKERSRSPHKSRRNDSRERTRLTIAFPLPPVTPRKGVEQDKESSDSESDDDTKDREYGTQSREKKLKKVDISNPFSTFEHQTRTRKQYLVPTTFVKEQWLKIRGMDTSGKFVSADESKLDSWKQVAKSDKIIKKFSGEIFSETRLDDGLHSIVDKSESAEEKDLTKYQKIFGSIGHLTLKTIEGYGTMYNKFDDYINRIIGPPRQENPDWKDESSEVPKYIWADYQIRAYNEHQANLQEFQVDVAEPLSSVARVEASAFTNMLDKRRDKVLSKIRNKNKNAATAIGRIPPSASSMFGGDHSQLEKTVQLTKDLMTSGEKSGGGGCSHQTHNNNNRSRPGSGSQYGGGGSHNRRDQGKGSSGGNNSGNNSAGDSGGSGGSGSRGRGSGSSFRGNSGRGKR